MNFKPMVYTIMYSSISQFCDGEDKKYNRLYYLFVLLFILTNANSSFSQNVINSSGYTINNNLVSIEYSIGEISITTLTGNQNYITQGILQPVLQFKDCNILKLIPNAFTPNGDNINDCFGMRNWPATSSYQLCIYNRWGQLVFKTTNILECWNGDFKGQPQPMGTYVYNIIANTVPCGESSIKGYITLIR
jgi:gliding motility-associated-like protein